MKKGYSLTNRDISANFRDYQYVLLPTDFTSALAYWITAQRTEQVTSLEKALQAYENYINQQFKNPEVPQHFTYMQIEDLVNDDLFESILEIEQFNKTTPDFIDLGALARNVFYMICREQITQPL